MATQSLKQTVHKGGILVSNSTENATTLVDEYAAKCPSCSASIKFDPSTGKLTCPYCGYDEEIPKPELKKEQIAQELDFESALERSSFNWGDEKKIVICDACGAESLYDALEIANVCPYCGSNHVMEAAAENALAPNGIIPFGITREEADVNFQKWIKRKWFAPKEAKQNAKADAFHGVYLPFWTFDTVTASQYKAQYGINRTVTDEDGNTRTETDWYKTSGFYQEFIDDYLVRATKRYDENLLEKVEPFDTNNSLAFSKEYLSGYIAERYSIGLDEGWEIAQKGIHDHLEYQIRSHIKRQHHADDVRFLKFSTTYSDIKFKYVMLPIWVSSFRYKEKTYQFLVNGQTGKVGGQSPISAIKVTITVLIILIAVVLVYGWLDGWFG